ncbi:uncharacterized protein LOC111024748 [Momordica charantia]|uniref:Uncharacterized protein LOC111024748 n=1 Tax=Momordica charantia TaxID=3673 RepID=A0A6J1DWM4_MOMCH|nr:uncharacterized protein LOC111024748 [Momordica charantia]
MAFRRNTRAHNYEDPNPRGEGAADPNIPPAVPGGVAPPRPQAAPQGVPQVALLAEALQVLLDNANGAGGAQVRGAVFILRGEAVNWWESVPAAEDHANVPVTWARFKDLLYEYYFPVTVRNEKWAEFLRLTQGSLTVAQYERKFTELSRIGMQYIPTEQLKIDKFIDGLRREIKGLLVLKEPTTYAAAVKCVLVMDKCLEEPQSQHVIGSSSGARGNLHCSPPVNPQEDTSIMCKGRLLLQCAPLVRRAMLGHVGWEKKYVTGIVLVLSMPAYALFDSGSSHSFIASTFVRQADLELESLGFVLSVSTLSGSVLVTSQVVKGGQLSFDGQTLEVKLIQLDMQDFDVIPGMDWLAANRANIDCSKKEASHLLQRGAWAYLASVVDARKVVLSIVAVCVVNEFTDVFPEDLPGLPPSREVDFCMELLPGTAPISKAPYRMAPAQLEELLDKGFIRPSVSPWGAPVLFVKKKDGSM